MADLLAVSNTGSPDRVADVVFLHGLNGDARSTWTTPTTPDGFWPGWLGAELHEVGIWSVAYDVRSTSWAGYSMALIDRAASVLDLLAEEGIGQRPVIFIVHSFGGLVVKQMLREAEHSPNASWSQIAAQTRGIVFLATPHSGSRLANWVRWIPLYFRTVTVTELEEHNTQLRDLGRWFREFYNRSRMKAIVYTETRNVKGVRVVHDGDPYLAGVRPVPLDEDHISITKPKSDRSQLYRGVRGFIQDCLAAVTAVGPTSAVAAASVAGSSPPVPAPGSGPPAPEGPKVNSDNTLTDVSAPVAFGKNIKIGS